MLTREILVHYRVALATDKGRRLKEDASVGCVFRPHTHIVKSVVVSAGH